MFPFMMRIFNLTAALVTREYSKNQQIFLILAKNLDRFGLYRAHNPISPIQILDYFDFLKPV